MRLASLYIKIMIKKSKILNLNVLVSVILQTLYGSDFQPVGPVTEKAHRSWNDDDSITFSAAHSVGRGGVVFSKLHRSPCVHLGGTFPTGLLWAARWPPSTSISMASIVPPVRLATIGSRAFPVAAAHTWNSLPEHTISASALQSFKRHLKTFLLQQSFPLAL